MVLVDVLLLCAAGVGLSAAFAYALDRLAVPLFREAAIMTSSHGEVHEA